MIALSPTDTNWFKFLRQHPDIPVVNFWTPTDWGIANMNRGDYWYFVLKGREPRKLGGGGRFLRYELISASEAWNRYGLGNGAATYGDMIARLNMYRTKRSHQETAKDPKIGCILLDQCTFLPDVHQRTTVEHNLHFPRQIVKYKTFNSSPIALLEELPPTNAVVSDNGLENPTSEEDSRKRVMAAIVRRQGQPQFRQALMSAYGGKCAITNCDEPDALEAAHITPYLGDHTNTIQNGILLRADLHTLFDLGKIAISSHDFKVILHPSLRSGHYSHLGGKMISVPIDKAYWPSRAALEKHSQNSGI